MKISISTLSTAYGLTPEALRYYEEKGLLTPERAGSGGFRRFSTVDVQIMGIIKSLQRQGFSLEEIRRVMLEGCTLDELIALMDEKRSQLTEQAALTHAICSRMTSCTDLLRDHERLLMKPRLSRGVAAYLIAFDSVAQLWENVPKMPILRDLIDALPLSSYCSIIPLEQLKGGSKEKRTGICVPAEFAAFIHSDLTQMTMSAGPRSVRMLFDVRPPKSSTIDHVVETMTTYMRENGHVPVSDGYTRQYSWHVNEHGERRQFSELIVPIM